MSGPDLLCDGKVLGLEGRRQTNLYDGHSIRTIKGTHATHMQVPHSASYINVEV